MTNGLLALTNDITKVQLISDDRLNLGETAAWLIALLALAFSIYQYFSTTRVKRLEYLDSLAVSLREEPLLRAATIMLDWEVRTLEVEDKFYAYSVLLLPRALLAQNAPTPESDTASAGFDETEVFIRDAFDTLFAFFENVQYAVHLGILKQADIYEAPMHYYLGKLVEKDAWTDGAITRYLEQYGFPKAKKLVNQYRDKIPAPGKLTPEQKLIFEAAFLEEIKKVREANADREHLRHSTPASARERA